jgi:hypothetical protein
MQDRRHAELKEPSVLIVGRDAIAEALGLSAKTVSRLIVRGLLPAAKNGPFPNSKLTARASDIARLRAIYGREAA